MNNSKIALDEVGLYLDEITDNADHLREREATLVRIIEAITGIMQSSEWSTLKSLIFDGEVDGLEKRLKSEAEQLIVNVPQLNFLQGKLSWARKYSDLEKLCSSFRVELSHIRQLLPKEAN